MAGDAKVIVATSLLERGLTALQLAGVGAEEIRAMVESRLSGEGFRAAAGRPGEPENLVTRARAAGIKVKTLSDYKKAKAALDGAA